TFTTTVLAFLSLTTVPCRILFGMVLALRLGSAALLGQHGLNARDVTAQRADAAGIFHLTVGALEAQVELLLLQVRKLSVQLVAGLGAQFLGLGRAFNGSSLLGRGLRFGFFLSHLYSLTG